MVPRSRSNKSILIADNDETFVHEMRLALEEAGFEVITAKDGGTVLTNAAIKPALILININLPILDGWRTAALLKTHKRQLQFLLFSSPMNIRRVMKCSASNWEAQITWLNQLRQRLSSR